MMMMKISNVFGALRRIPKGFGQRNQRTTGYHPDYSITNISRKTEMNPGNLRRLAITQTPVKKHQPMLV